MQQLAYLCGSPLQLDSDVVEDRSEFQQRVGGVCTSCVAGGALGRGSAERRRLMGRCGLSCVCLCLRVWNHRPPSAAAIVARGSLRDNRYALSSAPARLSRGSGRRDPVSRLLALLVIPLTAGALLGACEDREITPPVPGAREIVFTSSAVRVAPDQMRVDA